MKTPPFPRIGGAVVDRGVKGKAQRLIDLCSRRRAGGGVVRACVCPRGPWNEVAASAKTPGKGRRKAEGPFSAMPCAFEAGLAAGLARPPACVTFAQGMASEGAFARRVLPGADPRNATKDLDKRIAENSTVYHSKAGQRKKFTNGARAFYRADRPGNSQGAPSCTCLAFQGFHSCLLCQRATRLAAREPAPIPPGLWSSPFPARPRQNAAPHPSRSTRRAVRGQRLFLALCCLLRYNGKADLMQKLDGRTLRCRSMDD